MRLLSFFPLDESLPVLRLHLRFLVGVVQVCSLNSVGRVDLLQRFGRGFKSLSEHCYFAGVAKW